MRPDQIKVFMGDQWVWVDREDFNEGMREMLVKKLYAFAAFGGFLSGGSFGALICYLIVT